MYSSCNMCIWYYRCIPLFCYITKKTVDLQLSKKKVIASSVLWEKVTKTVFYDGVLPYSIYLGRISVQHPQTSHRICAYFLFHPLQSLPKAIHSMQQSEMTLMLTTRTPAMDYLSIWLHNRIMASEDELPCKPGKTSGVCVHLNPIYVFNGVGRRRTWQSANGT